MLKRLIVHQKLVDALPPSTPIIFQPSQSHNLPIPCVVYKLDEYVRSFSNNKPYVIGEVYEITLMSPRPGDVWGYYMLGVEGVSFLRRFINDDIVHEVYRLRYMTT